MVALLIMVVALGGILTACGEQTPEQNAGKGELKVQKDLTFGIVEWPGVTQKTYVLKEILDKLGYNVEIKTFTVPILIQGLASGDIDAFAGGWMVTMKTMLEKHLESGAIKKLNVNVDDCLYRPAVPTYVWEAGVKSLADLHKYADEFDRKYYGLEPGNDGNEVMIRAIENNTYNLGDWRVLESSTSAMLAEVRRATQEERWIVFSAWKPHWMNIEFDIKYLEDPLKIWGENDYVATLVRGGLPGDDPNVTRFLSQFKINTDIQSRWILEFDKKKRDPEEVAKEWIADNLDMVSSWLEGVKAIDGRDAQKVIKEAYES